MITVVAARLTVARVLLLASKRAAPASAYGVSRRKVDDTVAAHVLAIGEDEREAAAAIVQASDAVHRAYRPAPLADDEDLDEFDDDDL